MKNLFLFITLAFLFNSGFCQPFKTEQEYKDYLINNIETLDPIEGLWEANAVNEPSKIYATKKNFSITIPGFSSKCMIAIVKEGDYYVSYSTDIISFFKLACFDFRFRKTSISGLYLFDYSCSTDYWEGKANLTNNTELFFSAKKREVDDGVVGEKGVYVEMVKVSPNLDDIKKAMLKNPILPDKVGGTAFAIGDRYIVTAAHVVNGFNHFQVRGINGKINERYNCILSSIDTINDMAVLYISDLNFEGIKNIPYTIKSSSSLVGEKTFCLGYPLTSSMGEDIKLTDGLISAKSGFLGDTMQYQLSVPVQHGNSGGALFDYNGNLIGIVIAKHSEAENASYALKIASLKKLIKERPAISTMPQLSQLASKDLPTKVSLIQNYIYIIEAEK